MKEDDEVHIILVVHMYGNMQDSQHLKRVQ